MTDAIEPWAPEACTLPLVERPVRRGEFDALFVHGLTAQERLAPTVLRWMLDSRLEPAARDLAARETACCSFFTFDFEVTGNQLQVDVQVPHLQVRVLDALATWAAAHTAAT